MLRAIFSRQNASLVLGTVYLGQPRWPCQKLPLMKMTASSAQAGTEKNLQHRKKLAGTERNLQPAKET